MEHPAAPQRHRTRCIRAAGKEPSDRFRSVFTLGKGCPHGSAMMARVERFVACGVLFSNSDRDRSPGVRRMDAPASWKGPGQAMDCRTGAFLLEALLFAKPPSRGFTCRSVWNS